MKYFFALIATLLSFNLLASSPKLGFNSEGYKFSNAALNTNYFSVATSREAKKLSITKPANIKETMHSVVYVNKSLNSQVQNNTRTIEQEAGFQLKQSANLQLIAIGLQGLGFLLTSVGSISSTVGNNSAVAGGIIIGGICVLGGIGCNIASIFKKRQAGILLEMSNRN